jgi:hypothetical protein
MVRVDVHGATCDYVAEAMVDGFDIGYAAENSRRKIKAMCIYGKRHTLSRKAPQPKTGLFFGKRKKLVLYLV